MTYGAIKGILVALIGNGWKAVSFGLLLAVAGLSGYSFALKRETPSTQVVKQLQDDSKQAQVVQKGVHISASRARRTTEKLNHVLEVNKQWSDQPVPSAVIDELCRKVSCSEDTSKVPSPDDQPQHTRGARKRNQ